MIPYSRPKLSDFRTLSQAKQLENHTLHSGTYPYSVYMGVPPPGCQIAVLRIIATISVTLKTQSG